MWSHEGRNQALPKFSGVYSESASEGVISSKRSSPLSRVCPAVAVSALPVPVFSRPIIVLFEKVRRVMASEPGGRSDKLGNEFERLWAVSHLIELLSGKAISVLTRQGRNQKG
jgi:hypothetical protein